MRNLLVIAFILFSFEAKAVVFQISLDGIGGQGMLPTNENHVVNNGGTGGIGGAGISYDNNTGVLSIDIEWGSGNGFTDLSSPATAAHIHGPTASDLGFNQDAAPRYDLSIQPGFTFNTSLSNGALFGNVTLQPGDEADLINGKFYINVHTVLNAAGEIRGHLVIVPEPKATAAIIGLACLGAVTIRRRLHGHALSPNH